LAIDVEYWRAQPRRAGAVIKATPKRIEHPPKSIIIAARIANEYQNRNKSLGNTYKNAIPSPADPDLCGSRLDTGPESQDYGCPPPDLLQSPHSTTHQPAPRVPEDRETLSRRKDEGPPGSVSPGRHLWPQQLSACRKSPHFIHITSPLFLT